MNNFIIILVLSCVCSCNTTTDRVKKTYFNNDKLKTSYTLNSNNQKHGEFKAYYENGKLKEKCNYVNGVMHGPFFLWNEEGTLINRGDFTHGLQSDTSFYFDSTGVLDVYSILGDNEEIIKNVYFYKNGRVKEINLFYDGREDLVSYKNFSKNGKVIQGFLNSKYALFKERGEGELSASFMVSSILILIR